MRKSNILTLCYCWLLCFTAFRLENITREVLTNAILARSLGASFYGWRLDWLDLAIHVKPLPENAEAYLNLAKIWIPLVLACGFVWLERRFSGFSAKLLALYWALWSLLVFLQPLLFSRLFFGGSSAGLWHSLRLNQILRGASAVLLVVFTVGLAVKIFRRAMILTRGQFPVWTLAQRAIVVSVLFAFPLLGAWAAAFWRLVYFRFAEAGLYLVLVVAFLAVLSLASSIRQVAVPNPLPNPARSEVLWMLSLTCLLLGAVPVSHHLERLTNERGLASHLSQHFLITYSPAKISPESVAPFSNSAESTYARVSSQIGLQAPSSRLHFILFSSAEEKLIQAGRADVADLDSARDEIRLLFIPPFDRFDPALLGRFLLQKKFGGGRNSILETGLACLLTGQEARTSEVKGAGTRTEKELAGILAVEGPMGLYDLLFPSDPGMLSPFISGPMTQELASFLQARYGLERLLKLYSKELTALTADSDILNTLAISRLQLENEWEHHCLDLREVLCGLGANDVNAKSGGAGYRPPFQKGMSFSAEGGARTGYMSETACTSLDQLQQLHVEWLSLMPFAFSSWTNNQPRLFFSHRNSWEGDDNLRKISWEARKRGMRLFLKPHVWSREQSSVDFKISDPAAWKDWFGSYRRYIMHEARLAEAIGAQLFAIGNELPLLTLDAAHESDWRALISGVRQVFSGDITYCANWGEDFEQIRFADALDVVGLNAYYPLIAKPNAAIAEYRKGACAIADRVASVAARLQRPIIITEIGYPSTSQAAWRPWSENGSAASVAAQSEAAKAFLEAFWGRSWLRGIYWWKWYSHGRGGGENDASYMPRGKPLAAVIARWYSQPRE